MARSLIPAALASRRLGRRAVLLLGATSGASFALGRTPLGGALKLQLPWAVTRLDPHDLHDACGALFGTAVTDPLFAVDAHGRVYPALADGLPTSSGRAALVKLRPGLVTARGRPLAPADVAWSLSRARSRAARALLAEFGAIRATADGVRFENAAPARLANALSSPCCAIVPRAFTATQPDGTGAFAARIEAGGLVLARNPRAARGAGFLDRVSIASAPSLSDALRGFESGAADVGWLGDGLHRRRPGAQAFTGPLVGWVVLRTGSAAGAWHAPGVAQSLVAGLPSGSLARFALGSALAGATRWGNGDANLVVDAESPFLAEVADAVASSLSQPGHRLSVSRVSSADHARQRAGGGYALLLDFVRRLGSAPGLDGLALTTAANPALANRPPKLASMSLDQVARTLTLGVLGEVRPRGYIAGPWRELPSWDFGAVYAAKP